MKTKPILENEFYHDGRGPELQAVIWSMKGVILKGFEYYNPHDKYDDDNLRNISLLGVQVFSMTTDEVHANILATGESRAAIFEVINSPWLKSYNQTHLNYCKHFQIMFYDEIYDVVCEKIIAGLGKLNTSQ